MKKLLIIISLLITILIGIAIWFFLAATGGDKDGEFTDLNTVNTTRVDVPFGGDPAQKTKTIKTEQGEVIIRDVSLVPEARESSQGYFNLEPFAENNYFPDYNIVYTEDSESFTISLNNEPLAETRIAAESYLQTMLGISQADMCRLKSLVGVPFDVDPNYSGQNLGFSFCPGSVELE